MVIGSRKCFIRSHIHFVSRSNIKHRQLLYSLGMVESHTMTYTRASIVTNYKEFFKAQLDHHFYHVLSHSPFRIIVVVSPTFWFRAVTIPTQIGCNYGELFSQTRSNFVPHQVGLRIAMQQQQRKTISSFNKMDSSPTCVDLSLLKAIEHVCFHFQRVVFCCYFRTNWL